MSELQEVYSAYDTALGRVKALEDEGQDLRERYAVACKGNVMQRDALGVAYQRIETAEEALREIAVGAWEQEATPRKIAREALGDAEVEPLRGRLEAAGRFQMRVCQERDAALDRAEVAEATMREVAEQLRRVDVALAIELADRLDPPPEGENDA